MKRFALVFMLFLLFVGISHADLLTDGSFEYSSVYMGRRCFIDAGIIGIGFGDCKLSGSDQNFNVPTYWSMNDSIGDYAEIISKQGIEFGKTGLCDYTPSWGCFARNVASYSNLTSGTTLYDSCYYPNYVPFSIVSCSYPFPYIDHTVLAGSKALLVHNLPSMPCGYSDGTSCSQRNSSAYGFVYQNVTFPDENYKLSFDVRNCDYTPSQCRGEVNCVVSNYGNPRDATFGNFKVVIANDTTFSNISWQKTGSADYRTGWHHYEIDLSGVGESGNMTIGFGIDPVSESSSICVIYDNVTLTSVTAVVVPASDYIDDMNSMLGFPFEYIEGYGGYTVTEFTFKTSSNFDGIPIIVASVTTQQAVTCSGGVRNNFNVSLYYNNGSALLMPNDILNETHTGWVSAPCHWSVEYEFPVFNLDDLSYIMLTSGFYLNSFNTYIVTFDGNIFVRQTYSNIISESGVDEVQHGNPSLYPVILYNGVVNDSGCTSFDAYNFKKTEESSPGNIDYILLSSSGSPKQFGSETVTFAGRTKTSDHSYCWVDMDGYESTDYISINFTSENYNSINGVTTYDTSIIFPVTAVSGCSSKCIGTTRRVAVTDSYGGCVFNYIVNSSLCMEVISSFVPSTSGNWSWFTNATASFGNASDTFFNTVNANFPAFLKFLIAIIITLVVPLLLAAYVIKDHGGIVYITTFLAVSLFFVLWNYPNGWLPPIFLIIDVIIFILLIGVFGRKAITGG